MGQTTLTLGQGMLESKEKNSPAVMGLKNAPSEFFWTHCASIVESKNENFPHFTEEYGTLVTKVFEVQFKG